jgi:sterol desaturase/sphingolipid hydroxylase (fatty acid hydroxylase superfamily)
MSALVAQEAMIRGGVFAVVLGLMALWEIAAPRRRLTMPKVIRWSNNLGLVVVDTLILRLALPMMAVGVAVVATQRGWGIFPAVGLPGWAAIAATVLLLDLVIYFQHRVFHAIPALWRLHRMHHSDPDFDVTTALRFHPIEIFLSMLIKMAVVVLLGAPPEGVILFEVILNGSAMFNHANITLPPRLDRLLRRVIVTPDMHRVHHSEIKAEADSNFGFALAVWDHLFRTHIFEPEKGQLGVVFGIGAFKTRRELWLDRLVTQPFRPRS